MNDILPFPNITATDTKEQVGQINNYLIQLKETLEFVLSSIDYENLSPELKSMLNSYGKDIKASNEERQDQIQQVSKKSISVSDVINSAMFKSALKAVEEKIPEDFLVSVLEEETEEAKTYTFTDSKENTVTITINNASGPDV